MSTATTTVTQNGNSLMSIKTFVIPPGPHKPSVPKPSASSPISTNSATTIRLLYNRATRAFLHRDILLTYSLLEAAFANLQPPAMPASDALTDDRRKWDILRITLESTVYSSNFSQTEAAALPEPIRASLSETPHALVANFYKRSLSLFTPTDLIASGLNATHIPTQVLATLVLASLKLECPDFARIMIDDWLGRREPAVEDGTEPEDGYVKIIDLYCLHILPRLNQWDYVFEFLEYESELSAKTREGLKQNLKLLYAQSLARHDSSSICSKPKESESLTPRPHSPSSSSSSSLSTTSTHTIVPPNRVNGPMNHRSRSSSCSSFSSDVTARAKVQSQNLRTRIQAQNGHSPRLRNSRATSSSSTSGTRPSTLVRAAPTAQSAAVTRSNTYSLVKAVVFPYLTTRQLTTLFALFVIFPFVSLLIRRRRAKSSGTVGAQTGSKTAVSNVALVRWGIEQSGLLRRGWGEVLRAVADTVKMAGSGLV